MRKRKGWQYYPTDFVLPISDEEPEAGDVVGTAKAAKWLKVPERTIRDMCMKGRLKGAYQPAGFYGKWLIPEATLEEIRARPRGL